MAASLAYSYCDPDGSATAVNGTGCGVAGNWSSVNNATWYTLSPIEGIGAWPLVLTDGSVGVLYDDETGGPCTQSPTDNTCLNSTGSVLAWDVIPKAGAVVWPAALPSPETPFTITPYDSNGVQDQRAGSLPQAAVDPNTDEVYIVWEDDRFRTDGGSTAGSDTSSQNDSVIAYAKPDPTTGIPGMTPGSWSGPFVINPGPENNYVNHYNTTVAVGADSIVRVAYRQRDENPATYNQSTTPIDTEYQESRDGGGTWSTPLTVNMGAPTVDNEPGYGAYDTTNVHEGVFEGDYEQIAAGGYDESYVTRDEAYQQPGTSDPCPFCASTGFAGPASDDQWQQTWVAQIEPGPSANTPDARVVPALVLIGVGAIAVWSWRRRRTT